MATPRTDARVSRRVAAIAESATLAVDAKAKALKAAGEPVIGFGAGEPDFPTPAAHRRGRRRGLPRPEEPPVHAGRRACPSCKEAIAAKTAARLRRRRHRRARCSSPTAASTPSTTPSPTLLDPGDEVLLPAPYWTTYPEPIALAGGVPVVLPTDETTGFRVTVDQLEAAAHRRAPRRSCSCRRRTPPAPCTRATRSRPSAAGRVEHGIWVITDEIYEHLTYGDHRFTLDARARARAAPTAASCSTAWPRPTP